MDIPLQEKSAGKGYAKVALDDYEKDETNNEDDIPLQEGAIVAHVSINDGSADNDDDKETLLVEEGKKPEAASTGLPWRLLLSVYFIVWTESAVMNGFNPIIPGKLILYCFCILNNIYRDTHVLNNTIVYK